MEAHLEGRCLQRHSADHSYLPLITSWSCFLGETPLSHVLCSLLLHVIFLGHIYSRNEGVASLGVAHLVHSAFYWGKLRTPKVIFFFLFLVFCLFKAAPMAHGGSQVRGPFRATAPGQYHSHSNTGSEHVCKLHHSSWQCQILNPLSKARDWICKLMDPSRIRFHSATTGKPQKSFSNLKIEGGFSPGWYFFVNTIPSQT